jgi:rsbT co-antagonist protein RsbR
MDASGPTVAPWHTFERMQVVVDGIPDPIFVKDLQHRWVAFNAAFCGLLKLPRERLLGGSDPDLFPPDQVEVFWRVDDEVFHGGRSIENEELLTDAHGTVRTIWTRKAPLRDSSQAVIGLVGIITDVTDFKERVRRVERIEAEAKEQGARIAAQEAMLDALMMPIVEVWDGVLLLSLVGELRARRAARAMEELLAAISRTRARHVLIDVTGVPAVDTDVAAALLRTTTAAGLLGCESVLCGIGPEIAQTLVSLDVDFSRVAVCSTVRAGLSRATSLRAR